MAARRGAMGNGAAIGADAIQLRGWAGSGAGSGAGSIWRDSDVEIMCEKY